MKRVVRRVDRAVDSLNLAAGQSKPSAMFPCCMPMSRTIASLDLTKICPSNGYEFESVVFLQWFELSRRKLKPTRLVEPSC